MTRLYRGDDGGRIWAELLTGSEQDGRDFPPSTLAREPGAPDWVFCGGGAAEPGVQVSTNGGANWARLGGPDAPLRQFASGADGRYLYDVASNGIARLLLR